MLERTAAGAKAIAVDEATASEKRLTDLPMLWSEQWGAIGLQAPAQVSGGWLSTALLAERELQTQAVDGALARIDEALALARQGEGRSDLPFAHLLHGEILLERDPANPAPAEEAFQTAIAIAQEQGALLGTARGAVARQALSLDWPPRRSPRRPRAGARRFLADAGDAGDRGGAGATCRIGSGDCVANPVKNPCD